MLRGELQKWSPVRQRVGDRDGVEGNVDGSNFRRDCADVLVNRLLVEGIDLRRLGDAAAADDVGCNRFYLGKVASTQKELCTLASECARHRAVDIPSGSVNQRNLVLQDHLARSSGPLFIL